MNTRIRSRGLTLIELVMVLGLVGVCILIAGQVFRASFQAIDGTAKSDWRNTGFDHAMAALRRDIWASRKSNSEKPGELRLLIDDDRVILWSTTDSAFTRLEQRGQAVTDSRRWTNLPPATFAADGPSVTLTIAGKSGDERIEMISPLLLPEVHR
jgi:prepilin-type N-terminal cleavage/methylation domain-containing protein